MQREKNKRQFGGFEATYTSLDKTESIGEAGLGGKQRRVLNVLAVRRSGASTREQSECKWWAVEGRQVGRKIHMWKSLAQSY